MGLDVYMYEYVGKGDLPKAKLEFDKHYEIVEKITSQLYQENKGYYEKYKKLSMKAIKNYIKENNLMLSCNEYGELGLKEEEIEKCSEKYPEHMFKIGYYRSSYNSGGFNSYANAKVGYDLYNVFSPNRDDYFITPNWKECRVRAEHLIKQLKHADKFYVDRVASMQDSTRNYGEDGIPKKENLKKMIKVKDVAKVKGRIFDDVFVFEEPIEVVGVIDNIVFYKEGDDYKQHSLTESNNISPENAAHLFEKELESNNKYCYSNSSGRFWLDEPMKVHAMCESIQFGAKAVDLLVSETEEGFEWYLNAAEIVLESIDYVLSQDNPENYFFHWSA